VSSRPGIMERWRGFVKPFDRRGSRRAAEDFQKKVNQRPFQPFRMYLTDGAVYEIWHPEMVLLGKRSLVLGLSSDVTGSLSDRTGDVDLLHVVRMEYIDRTTQHGHEQKAGRNRPRRASTKVSLALLQQQPLVQFRHGVGAVPGIVSTPGNSCRAAGRRLLRARIISRDCPPGSPCRRPRGSTAGDVLELRGRLGVAAVADRHDRRPALRVRRGQAPGALAAHRQARQINAFSHRPDILSPPGRARPGRVAVLGVGLPTPFVRLREDGNKPEGLLLFADMRCQPALYLGTTVGSGRAGTVQEEDRRVRLLAS